ncbi:MAG: hypothetical protein DRH57_03720 [Candidatus Cloacimonadota bacterium]|nr:MAG: hypothetical protein DRH57_03720 [Candidatus Cloacimonadota bacterium]
MLEIKKTLISPLPYLIAITIFLNPLIITTQKALFFPYKLLFLQISIFFITILFIVSKKYYLKKRNPNVLIIIISYVAYCIINGLANHLSFYSLDILSYLLPFTVLFLILSQLNIKDIDRKLFANSLIFSFLISIIPGYFLQKSSGKSFARLFLNWGNPNFYGSYLLIILPFILYKWKISQKKWENVYFIGMFVIAIIILLLTQSRGALLSLIIVCFLTGLVLIIARRKFKYLIIFGISFFIIVVGIYYGFTKVRSNTVIFRERIYISTYDYIKDNLWIGTGLGTFAAYYPKYRQNDYKLVGQEDIISHPHNEFLEIWAETGMIGLTIFILILIGIVYLFFKKLKHLSGEAKYFLLASFLSFSLLIIHNLFTITMRQSAINVYFWIFAGFISMDYKDRTFKKYYKTKNNKKYLILFVIPIFILLLSQNYLTIKAMDYYTKSKQEFQRKNLKLSIQYAETGLQYLPNNSSILYHLGYAYYFIKNYNKALYFFDKLLEVSPYYPQAHYWKGFIYKHQKDYKKALTEYEKELQLNDYPEVYFKMAEIYHILGNKEQTANYIEKYLQKIVQKTEKNLMQSKNAIIKEKQDKINFSLRTLEEFYKDNDKKLNELNEIRNKLFVEF